MIFFLIVLFLLLAVWVLLVMYKNDKITIGHKPDSHEKLSVLIPFASKDPRRTATMQWVKKYYEFHLPKNTEFIVGTDFSTPFCKTAAVNQAARFATGDIIVILDADCYMDPADILSAASRIRSAAKKGIKTWFVPYRRFYRLTEAASERVLRSNPDHAMLFSDPPPWDDWEHNQTQVSAGHWWGALIQIMPLEAFKAAGGMDERFRGWGGEDVSFMHAVDTLWGKHKTSNNAVFHLWHETKKGAWKYTRMWDGQESPEQNDWLAGKYTDARNDYDRMKGLVNYK